MTDDDPFQKTLLTLHYFANSSNLRHRAPRNHRSNRLLSTLDDATAVASFEVRIEVELPAELKDKPLQFQMPKWSPGRYAVFDFAKNVQEFRAVDGICPPAALCSDKTSLSHAH